MNYIKHHYTGNFPIIVMNKNFYETWDTEQINQSKIQLYPVGTVGMKLVEHTGNSWSNVSNENRWVTASGKNQSD